MSGTPHLSTGIQIAQLALKHRQNKTQRQRIIIFVASPILESSQKLVQLAKKVKKNNVAVDIINFGEFEQNTSLLETFIQNVNSSDNSHLLTVPPGGYLLSDFIASSPILSGEDGVGGGGIGGSMSNMNGSGGDQFEFGIDPNMDPDLAMALKMSLEEEKARVEAETKRKEQEEQEKLGKLDKDDTNNTNHASGSTENSARQESDDHMQDADK